jgi:predicted ABC-type sugar transport system permease subunit
MSVLPDLAVDEFQVPWTLSVAISCTILGSSLVGGVLFQTAICVHRNKVQGTVEATRQFREIDVKGKLMVTRELEHLVCGIGSHQVCARANVGGVRALRDELE